MTAKTPLDRYFELVDSGGSVQAVLDGLSELFAENIEFIYSGEVSRGRVAVLRSHSELLAQRERSVHFWTVTSAGEGRITARWSEAGSGVDGDQFSSSGGVVAAVGADGRITKLDKIFDVGGAGRAKLMIGKHLDIWQTPDPVERLAKMKGVYTDDVQFVEAEVFTGHTAINDYIVDILKAAPLTFLKVKTFFYHHDYALYEWAVETATGEPASGWETVHFDGEMMDKIVVFSDHMDIIDGVDAPAGR